jgi:hypothetical protein
LQGEAAKKKGAGARKRKDPSLDSDAALNEDISSHRNAQDKFFILSIRN